jgi:hypothetical protein
MPDKRERRDRVYDDETAAKKARKERENAKRPKADQDPLKHLKNRGPLGKAFGPTTEELMRQAAKRREIPGFWGRPNANSLADVENPMHRQPKPHTNTRGRPHRSSRGR